MLCAAPGLQPLVLALTGVLRSLAGCNINWNTWWLGSRTQWNVTKDFYMGVDVMYPSWTADTTFERLHSAAMYRTPARAVTALRSFASTTRTTGRSGSASIATSILDRLIMDL